MVAHSPHRCGCSSCCCSRLGCHLCKLPAILQVAVIVMLLGYCCWGILQYDTNTTFSLFPQVGVVRVLRRAKSTGFISLTTSEAPVGRMAWYMDCHWY